MQRLVLWLDDIREPWKHGFIGCLWAKTADQAIDHLKTGRIELASLDHDLSEEATIGKPSPGEKTGYSVVLWLEENPSYWPPEGVRVHSMNLSGKQRMEAVIRKHYGRNFK